MVFTPPHSLYLSFLLLYLHFYFPTQFYPDSLHPHCVSCISTLISSIPHIFTRILIFPPWFPPVLLPLPMFSSFQPPFPQHSPDSVPWFPIRLPIASLCYWHSIIFVFQKIEFIKWIVDASIVKLIRIARSITLSKNAFKKYLFIKTNSCCSKLLSISEILVLNSTHH